MRHILWGACALAALFLLQLVWHVAAVALILGQPGFPRESWPSDFAVFWEVARFALDNDAARAFDPETMRPVWEAGDHGIPWAPAWLYPPTWLAAILPLGLLPYPFAYALFCAVSILVFARALSPAAAALPGGLVLVVSSPALLPSMIVGNNAMLLAGILAAAVWALREGREIRSGLLTACLAVKPQFAILMPVVYLAGRHRRAFLAAALATVAFTAAATVVAGPGYWEAFLSTALAPTLATGAPAVTGKTLTPDHELITPFAFFRTAGIGDARTALLLHAALALAAAGAVALAWARARNRDAATALLFLAVPFVTPRALFYDTAFLLVAFVFLWRAGAPRDWAGRLVLLACWIGAPRAANTLLDIRFAEVWGPLNLLLILYAAALAFGRAPLHAPPDAQNSVNAPR